MHAPGASAFVRWSRSRRLRCALALTITWAAAFLAISPQAQAAASIYFRSAATAETGNGATSITVNVPAGVVSGDVMIATLDAEGTASITAPAGWSSTGLFAGTTFWTGSSFTGYAGVYYHVAGASEPASYTWQLGTSRKAIGKIFSYVGVDNTSPIEASASAGVPPGTSATAPSITTTVANSMILADMAADNASGSFTITTPAGVTNRTQVFTSGAGSLVGGQGGDFIQAATGATPARTYTMSSSGNWGAITIALRPAATGALSFDVAPSVPTLPSVTLNGTAQTVNATMNNFAVDDTTSGSGWNVTVAGDTSAGKSPVFKQYCPSTTCGSDSGPGFITGGRTLPAGSLQLDTTSASWTTSGGAGSAPAFQCSSPSPTCAVDASLATKIVSTATGQGLGPWSTTGFSTTSLALKVPTTTYYLNQPNEVYHVDLVWTLNSGP